MRRNVSLAACGILSALLFYHLHGAGFPEQLPETEAEPVTVTLETVTPEDVLPPGPVTLHGFMHEDFLGEQTAVFPWTDGFEWQTMPENYIPLFVNGSVTDCMSVYMRDGTPMLPVAYVCEALGEEPVAEDGFLPADVLAELLGAEYYYYNDAERCENQMRESPDPHMMYNAEHVMIGKYPASAVKKTPEEAAAFLRGQLVTAYEAYYGTAFVPTDAEPEKNYGQDWDCWRISTLSADDILCETDRFYVIPYAWEFYVDKYTDEVYQMYNGLANTITRVEFESGNVLAPAG